MPAARSFALAALLLLVPAAVRAEAPAPACDAPWKPTEKTIVKRAPGAAVSVPAFDALPPAPPLDASLHGSIRRVDLPPGEKLVALTFDFCETAAEIAGYDGAVVEELRRRKIPATLFVGGHWAATHPARFGEMAGDPLFEIANHTWTHANLRTVDDERLAREILAPEAAFRAAVSGPVCPRPEAWDPAKRSKYLRFPFGACNARSMRAVNDAGMAAIQWDVSTGDPSPFVTADMIVAETLRSVRPGSIVLAHANGRGFHTAEALPRILDELTRRGYRFVTVGALLAAGRPVITETCYDARPGDTDRYDHLGRKPNPRPLPEPQRSQAAPTSGAAAVPKPVPIVPLPSTPSPLRPAL